MTNYNNFDIFEDARFIVLNDNKTTTAICVVFRCFIAQKIYFVKLIHVKMTLHMKKK